MPALVHTLSNYEIEAEAIETTGPGTAGPLAAKAAATGIEIVFACGGDGTVHEVLQGLVGTNAALGIVPIGTANVLVRNLKVSRDPVLAVAQQAVATAMRIPVGQIVYTTPLGQSETRYFTVIAGAGPDGALVHSLLAGQKSAMGRTAYYAHAARLFLSRRFHPFRVTYRLQGSPVWQTEKAVSVMAARIPNLGGLFSRLTPGCSLHGNTLRLFLVRPPAPISLPSWFVFGQLGLNHMNPWRRVLDAGEFHCEHLNQHNTVYSQVDGEWLGRLPISVTVVPHALSVLIP